MGLRRDDALGGTAPGRDVPGRVASATGRDAPGRVASATGGGWSATRVARFGVLLAIALVLYGVERLIPIPIPFLRLGLANIATVVMLVTAGVGDALLLTALRVTLASIIVGTFLGPGYALGLAGGLASAAAMGLAHRLTSPPLGIVGLSLVGAATHNAAQLAVVGGLFTGPAPAVKMLPAALLLAAATGLVTGLIALFALEKLPLRAR